MFISGHGGLAVGFEAGGSPAGGLPLDEWGWVQPAVARVTIRNIIIPKQGSVSRLQAATCGFSPEPPEGGTPSKNFAWIRAEMKLGPQPVAEYGQ